MTTDKSSNTGQDEEEAAFIRRLRDGDEEAFATLVRNYGGRLLSVARRLMGNEEDARDAVQDAFLSCLKSLDRFEGNARLSTWLHRIVVNSALMKLRSRKRSPEDSLDGMLPTYHEDGHRVDPGPAWRETAQDELLRKEVRDLVTRKIRELPDDYRSVLVLRDIEEVDTPTVAKLLGLEPGAVRVRLHRARQALRAFLDPHFRSA